jgi:hypothetical protein
LLKSDKKIRSIPNDIVNQEPLGRIVNYWSAYSQIFNEPRLERKEGGISKDLNLIDYMQSLLDPSFWRGDILIAEQQPLPIGQNGMRNDNTNLLPHYY